MLFLLTHFIKRTVLLFWGETSGRMSMDNARSSQNSVDCRANKCADQCVTALKHFWHSMHTKVPHTYFKSEFSQL